MRAVLVFAASFDDELHAVVSCVWLEGGGDVPGEGAGVVDGVGDGEDGDDVCGGAAEEDERDFGAGGGGGPD